MIEFTGERVIPGEVNDDLWAEHKARYAFAARYSAGARALDVGCGTGYGVADLAREARYAIGIDPAPDAIRFAREHDGSGNTRFLQASATALPFSDGLFDLVTAFEVIEHLEDWRGMLAEARRVTAPGGAFIVSTPNKLYYAESRAEEGPNPFHVHEFEFAEFRQALKEFFPQVAIFLQNRVESFAFSVTEGAESCPQARLDRDAPAPEEANFFVAVCSTAGDTGSRAFLYVPSSANLLRERERHIHLLEEELRQKEQWLADLSTRHKALQQLHGEQNRWALDLDRQWRAAMERIAQVQDELQSAQAGYERKIVELDQENRAKTQWAIETEARLSAEIAAVRAELAEAVRLLDRAEATVTERTLWAQDLEKRAKYLEAQLSMVRDSRWVRLGRAAGLGPRVDD